MPKMLVVYNRRTLELVPYTIGKHGDVIIMRGSGIAANDENTCNVLLVDANQVDIENGFVYIEGVLNGD